MTTRRKTFRLCLLSGLICGVLTASQCTYLNDACHGLVVGYMDSGNSILWLRDSLHWVHWLPGMVFGFVFAIAQWNNKSQIIRYTISSGLIYFGLSVLLDVVIY